MIFWEGTFVGLIPPNIQGKPHIWSHLEDSLMLRPWEAQERKTDFALFGSMLKGRVWIKFLRDSLEESA